MTNHFAKTDKQHTDYATMGRGCDHQFTFSLYPGQDSERTISQQLFHLAMDVSHIFHTFDMHSDIKHKIKNGKVTNQSVVIRFTSDDDNLSEDQNRCLFSQNIKFLLIEIKKKITRKYPGIRQDIVW